MALLTSVDYVPGTVIQSSVVEGNENEVRNLLNGTSTTIETILKFNGANPVLTVDATGAGSILTLKQSGVEKSAFVNNGGLRLGNTETLGTNQLLHVADGTGTAPDNAAIAQIRTSTDGKRGLLVQVDTTTATNHILEGFRDSSNVLTVNANGRLVVNSSQSSANNPTLSSGNITVGGTLAQSLTAVLNSGTSETDLQSITIPANTLANDGDYLEIETSGVLAANGNTKTIRAYFAGTVLVALVATTNDGSWLCKIKIIRTSSTAILVDLRITSEGNGSTMPDVDIVRTNQSFAVTFSNSNIFKMTGQSNVGSNDMSQNVTLIKKYSSA